MEGWVTRGSELLDKHFRIPYLPSNPFPVHSQSICNECSELCILKGGMLLHIMLTDTTPHPRPVRFPLPRRWPHRHHPTPSPCTLHPPARHWLHRHHTTPSPRTLPHLAPLPTLPTQTPTPSPVPYTPVRLWPHRHHPIPSLRTLPQTRAAAHRLNLIRCRGIEWAALPTITPCACANLCAVEMVAQ